MIYITGDTHGEYGRFSKKKMIKNGLELSEQDYVIICGDFGLCWAKDGTFDYECKFFANKKFTILWVQGNHENYDMIAEYPMEKWHGGNVRHIVRDKVILLERGQVFELEGHTFFTFGGASSHDIQGGILDREDVDFKKKKRKLKEKKLFYRINHESWWKEELPNETEMDEGRKNLAKHGYKVDYVITHCCTNSMQEKLNEEYKRELEPDVLTDYFQEIEEKMQYKHWYCGHYHMDVNFDKKHTILYHEIIELGKEEETIPFLEVLPYPCWQEKLRDEKLISQCATLIARSVRYVVFNEYEDAFLLDVQNGDTYYLGDYYGDPELALIDEQESFVVVVGSNHLGIFDLKNMQLELRDVDIPEWIISLKQEGRKIEVLCENDKRYVFEI